MGEPILISLKRYLKLSVLVLGEFCESEIGYLGLSVMQENVGDLEISVDYVFLCQVVEPTKHISYDGLCLLLSKVVFFPQFRLEITSVAKLCYYIAVSVAGEYFIALQYIRTVSYTHLTLPTICSV